jgi:hypothetical protein
MTAQQLAKSLGRQPFVPIEIKLDNGELILLALRGSAVMTEDRLVIGSAINPYAKPEERKMRVIPIDRVESVKDADVSRFEPYRRRK